MSATDLVAFGSGRLRPLGGDRRRGNVRLLRAAEMRLKTSRSDAGAARRGAGSAPVASAGTVAHVGIGPGLPSPPAVGGGEERVSFPPRPVAVVPHLLSPPGRPGG